MNARKRHAEIVRMNAEQFKSFVRSRGYIWGKIPAHEPWTDWFYLLQDLRSRFDKIPMNARLLATSWIGGDPQLPEISPSERLRRLAPWALDDLKKSGLAETYIDECRCYAPETDVRSVAAWMKKNRFLVYGEFEDVSIFRRQVRDCGPWLEIIYRDPARSYANRQTRMKPQFPWINGRGEEAKYLSARNSRNRLYVPATGFTARHFANAAEPIYITEGEKKADAANQAGLNCVAIPGVWGWVRKVVSQFRDLGEKDIIPDLLDIFKIGRRVNLIFDSDLEWNSNVQHALQSLADLAHDRFLCDVRNVKLPGTGPGGVLKVGLDDYLVAHSKTTLPNGPGGEPYAVADISGADAIRLLADRARPLPKHVPAWQTAGVGRCPDCANLDPCDACRRRYLQPAWYEGDPSTRGDPPPLPPTTCPNRIPKRVRHREHRHRFRNLLLDCGKWSCQVCRGKKMVNHCINLERIIRKRDGTYRKKELYYATIATEDYDRLRVQLSKRGIRYYAVDDEIGFSHIFTDKTYTYTPKGLGDKPGQPVVPAPLPAREWFREFVKRINAVGGWIRRRQKPVRKCKAWAFDNDNIKSGLWEAMVHADPSLDHMDWKNIAEELGGSAWESPGSTIDKSNRHGRYRSVHSLYEYRVPADRADEFAERVSLPVIATIAGEPQDNADQPVTKPPDPGGATGTLWLQPLLL